MVVGCPIEGPAPEAKAAGKIVSLSKLPILLERECVAEAGNTPLWRMSA